MIMYLKIAIIYCLLITCGGRSHENGDNYHDRSLLGRMTDIQSWVDEKGVIITRDDMNSVIDLSANPTPIETLRRKLENHRFTNIFVKYLSLARCRLTKVPRDFHLIEGLGRDLAQTVKYITFYGNDFMDWSAPGEQYDIQFNATGVREMAMGFQRRETDAVWSVGFKESMFPMLRELDLRACNIKLLSAKIFSGMPRLEALYLSENNIVYIDSDAFVGLNNLVHLDLSMNEPRDDNGPTTLDINSFEAFKDLKNLASLDLTKTKLTQRHTTSFSNLGKKLVRLSLFDSGLTNLMPEAFKSTSLKILDLSKNNGILSNHLALAGLEDTLEVLYAQMVGLRTLNPLQNLKNLQILDISINEISSLSGKTVENWKKLEILNLDNNRIPKWETPAISLMPNLRLFQLRENVLNMISSDLINDFKNIDYLSLSGNFIVCNCYSREFIDLAALNEVTKEHELIEDDAFDDGKTVFNFHVAYHDFNGIISRRQPIKIDAPLSEDHRKFNASFVLLDYNIHTGYSCMNVPESRTYLLTEVQRCTRGNNNDIDQKIQRTEYFIFASFSLPILMIILIFGFIFRRNFKYFFITMRNSAMLSLISKNDVLNDGAIFHYDVFVSYCNEDRNWVLDNLLPKLETDCMVSVCLHERDFQVGHSILENIVSCMDRSRSIMLILSKQFLLSKWCQFEMHLAQHRLLETRREDLTLILLEEIPRRMRPNTLHYLMLTKTYIVWPQEENEKELFWKRLKKCLVAIKMRPTSVEGVSLA